MALAAEAPSFDPAAFVGDLKALGCEPYTFRAVRPGGVLGPWRYGIASPHGFGHDFCEAMHR